MRDWSLLGLGELAEGGFEGDGVDAVRLLDLEVVDDVAAGGGIGAGAGPVAGALAAEAADRLIHPVVAEDVAKAGVEGWVEGHRLVGTAGGGEEGLSGFDAGAHLRRDVDAPDFWAWLIDGGGVGSSGVLI